MTSATNPFSFDRRGTLVLEGPKVRRTLVPELYETFRALERTGGLRRVIDAGMIETWADPSFGERTVAHSYIPFVTYPQEWTAEMLQEAAVCVLGVAAELADAGVSLQDPHPWNVTFVHGRPVYYDFSSIFEGVELSRRFVNDVFLGLYVPLWLRSRPRLSTPLGQIAEAVMNSEHDWRARHQPRNEWRRLFARERLGRMCRTFWRITDAYRGGNPSRMLRTLTDHVAALDIKQVTTDAEESERESVNFGDPASFDDRAQAAAELIGRVETGKVLDLGCDRGWFCGYASSLGHTVLGVELDPAALRVLHARRRDWRFDVAKMNALWPTPPQGAFLMYPSAFERFKSDTVLLIGVLHHFVLRQQATFESLAALSERFGAQCVIVEWIAPDSELLREWIDRGRLTSIPRWYTEDAFVRAMTSRYPNYERVGGEANGTRPMERAYYAFRR